MADKGLNKVMLIGRLGPRPGDALHPDGQGGRPLLAGGQPGPARRGRPARRGGGVVHRRGLGGPRRDVQRVPAQGLALLHRGPAPVAGATPTPRATPRATVEVVASDLVMLDGRREAAGTSPGRGGRGREHTGRAGDGRRGDAVLAAGARAGGGDAARPSAGEGFPWRRSSRQPRLTRSLAGSSAPAPATATPSTSSSSATSGASTRWPTACSATPTRRSTSPRTAS